MEHGDRGVLAVRPHAQQRVCAGVGHQVATWNRHESVGIGVQVRAAIVREAAIRVVGRLVGADVGDDPPLAAGGKADERGEAREFGDQRDQTTAHRIVLPPDRHRRVTMRKDDIRGPGASGAVGECRRWQPRHDPCLHATPQPADGAGGSIALHAALGAGVAAWIRAGSRYNPRSAPGFGDVQRAVGPEREAAGTVERGHDWSFDGACATGRAGTPKTAMASPAADDQRTN